MAFFWNKKIFKNKILILRLGGVFGMKYLSNFINKRLNHSLEGETIDASKLVDDMKNEVLIEESLLGYNIHWITINIKSS